MDTKMTDTVEPLVNRLDEEALKSYLFRYLKGQKYKIVNDAIDISFDEGHIIAISRSGRKELIEVKGYPCRDVLKNTIKKADAKQQARSWFSEALLALFMHFGRYGWNGKITLALCLPNTERYHQIIKNVQGYFTANNLNLKVYLVNEDGTVEIQNLNENLSRPK